MTHFHNSLNALCLFPHPRSEAERGRGTAPIGAGEGALGGASREAAKTALRLCELPKDHEEARPLAPSTTRFARGSPPPLRGAESAYCAACAAFAGAGGGVVWASLSRPRGWQLRSRSRKARPNPELPTRMLVRG